jgi:hypothetical protein
MVASAEALLAARLWGYYPNAVVRKIPKAEPFEAFTGWKEKG